jgi:transposase
MQSALKEKTRSGAPPKIDGRAKAEVVTIACSKPPDGRSRWTLRLMADRAVELNVVDSISHTTILRILKKMRSSRGRRSNGV